MNRSGRVPRLVLPAALSVVLLAASPASASCAAPVSTGQSMKNVELVFVGTVDKVSNNGRWATFAIDELWKGTPDSMRVDVQGGPKGSMHSSVERTYALGTRYLVMATDPKGAGYDSLYGFHSRFEDNICSGTRPYVATLERFRPKTRLPLPTKTEVATSSGSTRTRVLVVGGLTICAALCAGGLSRRRRRRSEV